MTSAQTTYVRTHRKRSGLTQAELAFLLGLKSGQMISRLEFLERKPSLETLFALQAVFGALPHELYPGVHGEVEQITLRRMDALVDRLEEDGNPSLAARKRDVLTRAIERIEQRRQQL